MLAQADIEASPTEHSEQGIILASPRDVTELPGFDQGAVSVQDEAAQLAASLLQLRDGDSVLDACCAPGGKTCHILETRSDLGSVLALIWSQDAWLRVEENLSAWASTLK